MRKLVLISFVILLLMSCNYSQQAFSDYESEILKIEKIHNNLFVHTSYLQSKNYGKYPCNGLIYINSDEAIIFDTPTNNKAASELIQWVGEKKIKAVIVTHFHVDCLGGLQMFHSKSIKSFATIRTIELAKENIQILPEYSFEKSMEFDVGNEVIYAKFFGEGHTEDNIVGYIPSRKTLFGGCLIKHMNAKKGNISDATTDDWPETVENIKNYFPEIEMVIPGHGKTGGPELLDYTIQLFEN
ncbi:metallo-beta-lactamase class B [Marivirga sericea]|uniref:beta-lactamase n=1 Tax=Marivirga sericea TaxID=1028 RepID=A0A1X7K667_9BACT|nr:subclass B1 metallo-beta-lactamase [Marivirga sericea]SMG36139.1 metallo-beta-lactamase class B [Marivirga sericea]